MVSRTRTHIKARQRVDHPDFLTEALKNLERGFQVFQLQPQSKEPYPSSRGFYDASSDRDRVSRWWKQRPAANLAIRTGAESGIFVLDQDGKSAGEWLATKDLPPTLAAKTRHGRHYYFRHPGGKVKNRTDKNPLGGVDGLHIRGDGGYVVAPPSIHPDGGSYEWLIDGPIADAPQWLLDLLDDPEPERKPRHFADEPATGTREEAYATAALQRELETLSRAAEGSRNDTLNSCAYSLGQLVGGNVLSESHVEDCLLATAMHIGLTEREAARTIKSGLQDGKQSPRGVPADELKRSNGKRPLSGDEEEQAQQLVDGDPASWPYTVEKGRIIFHERRFVRNQWETTKKPVCDFSARIVEEVTTEEGERAFRIEGATMGGKPFSLEILALDYADDRKLKALLTDAVGAKSPVRNRMGGHLPPAISLLSGDVSQSRRFHRTGWHADQFLIPGTERQGDSIHLPAQLPYGVHSKEQEKGIKALRALARAQRSEVAAVALTAFFQAPMSLLAGWRNERYAVFVNGRTGSLKTSWAQTAMCIYGSGFHEESNLIRFGEGATRNAMLKLASHAHDLPFLIDNYKPNTGRGGSDFVNLIHAILEGGEKLRLNRASELRDSAAVYCWPILTGEDVPSDDAAAIARVLVVPFSWPSGTPNPNLSLAQEHSNALPAIGAAWIHWLESDEGRAAVKRQASRFRDQQAEWVRYLGAAQPDMINSLRVATNLTTNQLTWQAMMDCPPVHDALCGFSEAHQRGLKEVAKEMATQTRQSFEAIRYLDAVRSLVASGRGIILEPGFGMPNDPGKILFGVRSGDLSSVWLIPAVVRREVEGLLRDSGGLHGISDQALYVQLDNLGHIQSKGKDQVTINHKVNGKTAKCLHLKVSALEEEATDDTSPVTENGNGFSNPRRFHSLT